MKAKKNYKKAEHYIPAGLLEGKADVKELNAVCREGEHRWKAVEYSVFSYRLRHKCTRCGAEKEEAA